jgi:hypothetical protein
MRRLLVLCLLALPASPALAAEPESGTVSRSQPKVTWTGAITSFQSWQLYNQGINECLPLSCDTFTLELADGPAPLRISVESDDSAIMVEVVQPNGESVVFSGETKAQGTLKDAANGSYTINVAQNEQTQAEHTGTAELLFPQPEPPAPPAAGAPPAAAPAPTITIGRTVRRGRLTVGTSAPLTDVVVTLAKGRRVVARARVARLEGERAVRLRGRLKRGRYLARVTGRDAEGRTVMRTLKVKVAR